jgi:hypothetical protein
MRTSGAKESVQATPQLKPPPAHATWDKNYDSPLCDSLYNLVTSQREPILLY